MASEGSRPFEGMTALVTGASRGIGAAIAVALAQAGADVACAARTTAAAPSPVPGTLDETTARIEAAGGRALAIPTNLAREDDVVAMVAKTGDVFGRLDLLVNNAAVASAGALDIGRKQFDLMFAVNVRAPMVAMREAAPLMRRRDGGRVLNISSAAASYAIPGLMTYGMSKLALEHLSVSAAHELGGDGIAVNCFRVDLGTASEGMIVRTGGAASQWEPTAVAAEGAIWMLRQPKSYTARLVSMAALREREGIMASQAAVPRGPGGVPIFPGLERSV
jgi:citronellol/citronellal dehydrogenase